MFVRSGGAVRPRDDSLHCHLPTLIVRIRLASSSLSAMMKPPSPIDYSVNMKEQIQAILDSLIHMYRRPELYFRDASHCQGILSGQKLTIFTLGIIANELYNSIYQQVIQGYGWTDTEWSVYGQMTNGGYTDADIIEELLAIEIETWQRILTEATP